MTGTTKNKRSFGEHRPTVPSVNLNAWKRSFCLCKYGEICNNYGLSYNNHLFSIFSISVHWYCWIYPTLCNFECNSSCRIAWHNVHKVRHACSRAWTGETENNWFQIFFHFPFHFEIGDAYVVVGNILNDIPDDHALKVVGLANSVLFLIT